MTIRTMTIAPRGVYDAYVEKVHDGDTITRLLVPVVFAGRLDGIQAPELSTPRGKVSAAYLQNRLTGKWVQAEFKGAYKFGGDPQEFMVVVTEGGTVVATDMIAQGLAVAWDGKGPRPTALTREELATMTTDEKLDLLMAEREQRRDDDFRQASVTPAKLDPPAPTPRPPIDWSPILTGAFRVLIAALTAIAAYYGVSASQKAGDASSHAEAAVVQSKENAVKIDQTHQAVKQVEKVAGAVGAADRVPSPK